MFWGLGLRIGFQSWGGRSFWLLLGLRAWVFGLDAEKPWLSVLKMMPLGALYMMRGCGLYEDNNLENLHPQYQKRPPMHIVEVCRFKRCGSQACGREWVRLKSNLPKPINKKNLPINLNPKPRSRRFWTWVQCRCSAVWVKSKGLGFRV